MIAPGADIKQGEPVMELETDKAVIEVPSSVTGVVREIRVKEGDKLKVGQVIFTVENGSGARAKAPKAPAAKSVTLEPHAPARIETQSQIEETRPEPPETTAPPAH